MTQARLAYLIEENLFLRTWVRELLQERDSIRQELIDAKEELMFPTKPKSIVFSTSYEKEDLPF